MAATRAFTQVRKDPAADSNDKQHGSTLEYQEMMKTVMNGVNWAEERNRRSRIEQLQILLYVWAGSHDVCVFACVCVCACV